MREIKTAIDILMTNKNSVKIAIDGRCAAGKTTLANSLSTAYDSTIIHMDDFFLPLELRNKNRYAEPGGNIHYERFFEEVACGLKSGNPFEYNILNCEKMKFCGAVQVQFTPLIIVEGTYALRPEFRDLYDLKIFLDINPDEQKRRILERNGESEYQTFVKSWIPMEELYFRELDVTKFCNFVIFS